MGAGAQSSTEPGILNLALRDGRSDSWIDEGNSRAAIFDISRDEPSNDEKRSLLSRPNKGVGSESVSSSVFDGTKKELKNACHSSYLLSTKPCIPERRSKRDF